MGGWEGAEGGVVTRGELLPRGLWSVGSQVEGGVELLVEKGALWRKERGRLPVGQL